MQAKQFTNFSTNDFSWKFDGVEYAFPAGATMFLEDYKADHFAKHLIDREMTIRGVVTDNKTVRNELLAKCFVVPEVVTPAEAFNIEAKKTVAKKKKVVEEEFIDLKNK